MALTKNFKELFEDPDSESEKWDDKLFELGYNGAIIELEEHMNTADEIYFDENQIITAISEFTKRTVTRKEKERLLKSLKQDGIAKKIKISDSTVVIQTDKMSIRAGKLSDFIIELKCDKDIESESRYGKCHPNSMMISSRLGIPNKLVTGYIFGYSNNSKYLHSWVEFLYQDQELVIDYTKNLIVNKDAYYMLTHAIPLSRISDKDIRADFTNYFDKFTKLNPVNIKEYLVFRDEIVKDFEKNKQLFEEER